MNGPVKIVIPSFCIDFEPLKSKFADKSLFTFLLTNLCLLFAGNGFPISGSFLKESWTKRVEEVRTGEQTTYSRSKHPKTDLR